MRVDIAWPDGMTLSKGIRSLNNGSRKGPESLHPVRESHLSVSMR